MVELMVWAELSSLVDEGDTCMPDRCSIWHPQRAADQNNKDKRVGSASLSSDQGTLMECLHTVFMTMLSYGTTRSLRDFCSRLEALDLPGPPTLYAERLALSPC